MYVVRRKTMKDFIMILALVVLLLGGGYGWVEWCMANERATLERMTRAAAAEEQACTELGLAERGVGYRPRWLHLMPVESGGAFRCIDVNGGEHHLLPPRCNRFRLNECK
jgi:hypothetical protein